MSQPLHIGLVFDYNLAYPRGVLRGVKQFAQTRPDWILVPLDTDGLTAQALQVMRPAGLIALVVTDALAEALRSLRRPLVNVASVLSDLPFPRVGVDHRRVHLERAKDLLATTTLPMAEVTEQAGFTSVHYLSRVFRQETGLTPTGYRRQFRS